MENKQKLTNEIELVKTLRIIVQAYQEIAVMKMRKVRTSVLKTRQFLELLSQVFYDVKNSYQHQIEALVKSKNTKELAKLSTFHKNGKNVSVFLSANNKLYGEVIFKVFDMFERYIEKNTTDLVIIGKLGKELYEQAGLEKPYIYYDIPDADVTVDDLKPVIVNLLNYEKINVFYGKFENIITQNAAVTNVTGDSSFSIDNTHDSARDNFTQEVPGYADRKFLFEPSLDVILNFFQTQIFGSLFKQTVYEAQLARFASRITAMEEALKNIDTRTQSLFRQEKKMKRLKEHKKMIETLSGISLWHR